MCKKSIAPAAQKDPRTGGKKRTLLYLLAAVFLLSPFFGARPAAAQSGISADGSSIKDKRARTVEISPLPDQVSRQGFNNLWQLNWHLVNSNKLPADFDFEGFDVNGSPIRRGTITLAPGETMMVAAEKIFPELPTETFGRIDVQSSVQPDQPTIAQAVQLPVGFFSQHQSPWNTYQLGGCTGDTIGSAGCAVTSVAMAMTSSVSNLDPGVLNTYLTNNSGYVGGGCIIIWSKPAGIDGAGGFSHYGDSTVQSAANLKTLIDNGKFAVVRSTRFSSHFVVIIGYYNNGTILPDFYYLDPEDASAVLRPINNSWVKTTSATHIYK